MTAAGTSAAAATTTDVGSFATTFDADPWDYYERLRELGPVVWDETLKAWLVHSQSLLKAMQLDDDVVWRGSVVYDQERPQLGMTREEWTEYMGPTSRALVLQEGPEHDVNHRWWFRSLSPKVLRHWGETLIEPIAHRQIDLFSSRGSAELGSELCDSVMSRVMAAMLGLPWDDEAWYQAFIQLAAEKNEIFEHGNEPPHEVVERGLAAVREEHALLLPLIRERRGGEGTDWLAAAWRDGPEMFGTDDFDEWDILSQAAVALSAGSSTSAAAAAGGLQLLLSTPGLADEVRAGGEPALKRFSEEALRLHGAVEWQPRWAKRDTTLGGVAIKRGDMVIRLHAAANRDPARYPCPNDVDLHRAAPRDHFAFGQGPRICAGQSLARFQIERLYAVALDRMPDMRLDRDQVAPRYKGSMLRRWEPLNVVFTPN